MSGRKNKRECRKSLFVVPVSLTCPTEDGFMSWFWHVLRLCVGVLYSHKLSVQTCSCYGSLKAQPDSLCGALEG